MFNSVPSLRLLRLCPGERPFQAIKGNRAAHSNKHFLIVCYGNVCIARELSFAFHLIPSCHFASRSLVAFCDSFAKRVKGEAEVLMELELRRVTKTKG